MNARVSPPPHPGSYEGMRRAVTYAHDPPSAFAVIPEFIYPSRSTTVFVRSLFSKVYSSWTHPKRLRCSITKSKLSKKVSGPEHLRFVQNTRTSSLRCMPSSGFVGFCFFFASGPTPSYIIRFMLRKSDKRLKQFYFVFF